PVRIAAQVPDFDITPFIPSAHRKSLKIMGRAARFGVAAAGLAVQDSGLDLEHIDPETVGVIMGTGLVPIDLAEIAPLLRESIGPDVPLQLERLGRQSNGSLYPLWILKYLPNM